MNMAEGSILVQASIGTVYRQWVRFEDFPKFITAIKEVQKVDANHFSIFVARDGKRRERVLEIMLRVPERRLAWRVLAGESSPDHLATGVVSFTAPSDQSTSVTLKINSSFDGDNTRLVDRYLQNFKRLIEKS